MISPIFMLNARRVRWLRLIWRWVLSLGLRVVDDLRRQTAECATAPDFHGRSFPTMMLWEAGERPDETSHWGSRASTMRSTTANDCNNIDLFYEISRYPATLGPPFKTRTPALRSWRRAKPDPSPGGERA